MNSRKLAFRLFTFPAIVVLLLSACSITKTTPDGGAAGAAATGTPAAGSSLNAVLSEASGQVEAREPSASDFQAAGVGAVIQQQGQVRTGADGHVRLDLSTGTIIRVSPSSTFTLTSNEQSDGSLLTKLKLEAGTIWIVLNGGRADVDTPSGQASVRGSYMSVYVDPVTLEVTITCLEGDCSAMNAAGESRTGAGGAITMKFDPATNTFSPPDGSRMTQEQIQAWLDNSPEAQDILAQAYATMTAFPTPTPVATATPQPTSTPVVLGPDQFPDNVNPLTGMEVENPEDLKLPAVLVSIPEFPVSARPQSGLSFASWIYEIYIGDGESRMMGVFYGDFPRFGDFLKGGCEVSHYTSVYQALGNRVWNDKNQNGIQDPGERGIPGVCVTIYDAETGEIFGTATTDSNGFYYVLYIPGHKYQIEFNPKNDALLFTKPDATVDDKDSDADPVTHRTPVFTAVGQDLTIDAGLYQDPTKDSGFTIPFPIGEEPKVGPIRSGRLVYAYIANFFQNSCLVYASGDPRVLTHLPKCHFQYGSEQGDINSAFLDVTKMRDLALANEDPAHPFNYTGNLFDATPPGGGSGPVNQIQVFWNIWNQVLWKYNPASGMWDRYRDHGSDNPQNGPIDWTESTDRLNGQQLQFSNIIFLFADHNKIANRIYDVMIEQGNKGKAVLFRDGQRYDILWTTMSGEYEKTTGLRRPIRYTDLDGNPIALKPGPTWVYIWTPYSSLEETAMGSWYARFIQP